MVYKLYCNGKLAAANEDLKKIYIFAAKIHVAFGFDFMVFKISKVEGRVH